MAASDWAYYDEDRQEYGYWLDEGRVWVPCDRPGSGWGGE